VSKLDLKDQLVSLHLEVLLNKNVIQTYKFVVLTRNLAAITESDSEAKTEQTATFV